MNVRKLVLPVAIALLASTAAAPANPVLRGAADSAAQTQPFPYAGPLHEIHGYIKAINGTTVTLLTRRGIATVDASYAINNQLTAPLFVGRPVLARVAFVGKTIHAFNIQGETSPRAYWTPDT